MSTSICLEDSVQHWTYDMKYIKWPRKYGVNIRFCSCSGCSVSQQHISVKHVLSYLLDKSLFWNLLESTGTASPQVQSVTKTSVWGITKNWALTWLLSLYDFWPCLEFFKLSFHSWSDYWTTGDHTSLYTWHYLCNFKHNTREERIYQILFLKGL